MPRGSPREGFRVIMPDLRAHGLSGRPHEPEHYPRGILARDLRELIAHLGLTEFDLGGFSLGARTTVEGVGRGPEAAARDSRRRGARGLRHWERRKHFFLDAIELFDRVQRGDPHWLSIQFMKSQKIDRVARGLLLESFADAFMDWLKAFTMPTLVVCGIGGRRQWLGGGTRRGDPQRHLQRGARHAHELGHQAEFGRSDR